MDAPPDKEHSAPFVDIDGRLRKAGLHAPEIFNHDLDAGFMLLEDLGDDLYRDIVTEQNFKPFFSEAFSALDPESYKGVARRAVETYPNVTHVGTTLRVAKTGLLNDWRTLLFDGQAFYLSRTYEDLEMVDRVGGGDSFSAGLIASLLEGKSPQEAVDFAGAYSALAHTFPGDVNWATRSEAEAAMKGGSARIRR